MTLGKLNKYLSIYQFTGFIIAFIILTINCLNEGRMMVFYTPIAGLLFLPFLTVSGLSLLDKEKHKKKIKIGIHAGLLSLVIPSLFLPTFYEIGGLIFTITCISISILTLLSKKNLDRQLIIINAIGGMFLTAVIVLYSLTLTT